MNESGENLPAADNQQEIAGNFEQQQTERLLNRMHERISKTCDNIKPYLDFGTLVATYESLHEVIDWVEKATQQIPSSSSETTRDAPKR